MYNIITINILLPIYVYIYSNYNNCTLTYISASTSTVLILVQVQIFVQYFDPSFVFYRYDLVLYRPYCTLPLSYTCSVVILLIGNTSLNTCHFYQHLAQQNGVVMSHLHHWLNHTTAVPMQFKPCTTSQIDLFEVYSDWVHCTYVHCGRENFYHFSQSQYSASCS